MKKQPKTRIVGIGAGGHAKVMLDIVRMRERFEVVGLVDRDPGRHGSEVGGARVLGDDILLPDLLRQGVTTAFIGIGGVGDMAPRRLAYEHVAGLGFEIADVIHPRAFISESVEKGRGVTIMAAVVVNAGAKLGENIILNSGSIIEHDCVIEDHAHVAPGAVLAGSVKVGEAAFIGAGAVIRQGVIIGARAVVGAGAVVVKDVAPDTTVIGCPAAPRRTG